MGLIGCVASVRQQSRSAAALAQRNVRLPTCLPAVACRVSGPLLRSSVAAQAVRRLMRAVQSLACSGACQRHLDKSCSARLMMFVQVTSTLSCSQSKCCVCRGAWLGQRLDDTACSARLPWVWRRRQRRKDRQRGARLITAAQVRPLSGCSFQQAYADQTATTRSAYPVFVSRMVASH